MANPITGAFGVYLVVGALATSVHYAILLALVEGLGVAPPIAAATGAACGALAAYAGNRRYTFASHAAHGQALPRFLAVAALGAAANGALVWAGSGPLALHYLVAQLVATATVVTCTFALNRRWSFA